MVSRMVMDLRLCVDKIVVVWAIRVMDLVSRGVVTTFSSVVIHERGARDGATQVLLADVALSHSWTSARSAPHALLLAARSRRWPSVRPNTFSSVMAIATDTKSSSIRL